MSNPLNDRASREEQSREAESREMAWKPPSALPDPQPRPSLVHRWVRTSSGGQTDPINVANSFREGWVAVAGTEYPELRILNDPGTRWPEGIEVGGLLLCSAPASMLTQRTEHYHKMIKDQIQSVNDNLMREQDPRLKTMFREHVTTHSRGFGPGVRTGPPVEI